MAHLYKIDIENKPSGYADVYVDDVKVDRFTGPDAIGKAAKKIEELQKEEHDDGWTVATF